jgi:serine/threonine protein kinase
MVDHRADIYSLGMCFYNMVSGRYAFEEESFTAVLLAICHHPLPNLAAMVPTLPISVVGWFERCCAKNPGERFQSAEEAFVALRAAAEDVGTSRVTGERDETLRGHRAPLSQRNPPLGTADSASYPGTQAMARVVPRSTPWVALLLAAGGIAILGAIIAFALSRFGVRDAPSQVAAGATTSAAIEVRPVTTASAHAPPAASEATPPAPLASDPAPRPAAPAQTGVSAKKSGSKPQPPAPSRPPEQRRPSRRTPTDLGF